MVKHKPETPLPFSATVIYIDARDENGTLRGEKDAKGAFHSIATCHGKRGKQHAEYLAHAANAYPKLVESLASFLRAPAIGSSGPGSITLEVQSFNREAAVALLRELGE